MRVLVVKTSSMGDVLHTLPALTDARNQFPDIKFDWVVEEGFAQIPTWHDAVENVIPVAIRRWRKNWFREDIRQERALFRQKLLQHQYDAIIDAQGLLKSAFLVTRLANGPKHGYDKKNIREPLASFFYDHCHAVSKQQHAVERIRILFAESLGYKKPLEQGDYAIARHFLNQKTGNQSNYLVFLHATTRDEKHWPENHWRQLIAEIESTGMRIKLPWGAEHEHQRAIRLAEGFSHVDILPKLTLAEVARVLAGAKAVVSVDTGLSHLTAALDRPNITLFGPTDPGLIGGYGKEQYPLKSVDCTMQGVGPLEVMQLLKEISTPTK
ncbi:lipopolysaccharide heptosyltransferase I [Xenorhabdus mauleonii]|uniref:Lipopolysaccharide heptosyltransferase 1 n=1 Tax=Xenorhabdus mauleonii TaxID=351675 RepID=A0A1I3TYX4_9GAMM|nr:lipopolysaccharide heptosyltransferase RfaC [Xenorhabdus mauleonii]PHM39584.1 lipopolysaccharide heptosyltransferase I [Xenorhabdus mauleonii]SFJ74761.1 heptosyltransferase-1 [Xenorhabdus mauleonii]